MQSLSVLFFFPAILSHIPMKQSPGKGHSYTVSFGSLEISVSSNSTEAERIVPKHISKPSLRDAALQKMLEKARQRDADKNITRNDAYWERQHAVVAKKVPPQPVTPKCSLTPPSEGYNHLPSYVKSVVNTRENDEIVGRAIEVASHGTYKTNAKIQDFFIGDGPAIMCWTCSHAISRKMFAQYPKFIPFRYHPNTTYFMVRGYFCSWECARMHALSCGGNLHMVHMLVFMLRKIFGITIAIRPMCTRLQLEVFGGTVSDSEFRSSFHACNNEDITHRLEWHTSIDNCVRVFGTI